MYNDQKSEVNLLHKPTMDDLISELTAIIQVNTKSLKLPSHQQEAAKQFLHIIEQQKPSESIRIRKTLTKNNTEKLSFAWPYAERVKYYLIKFLSSGHKLQTLIVAAREDNIFWRGDDFELFLGVIAETEKMRSMSLSEYRKQTLRGMRGFVKTKTIRSKAA